MIFREAGDRYSEGQVLGNLGTAYHGLQQADQTAICWRDAALAMRDVGDDEEAVRFDQLSVNARPRRHRWRPGA